MVRLRLQRTGTKNEPHYRVVVADSRSPRDGKFIEILGHYHPVYKTGKTVIKEEKVVQWLKRGAQPTDTVKELLKKTGVWSKYKDKKVPDES